MSATQMNVRLDSAVKRAGDAVFADHGYTPSQVVRAVWDYAVVYGSLPLELSRMLEAPAPRESGESSTCMSVGAAGAELIASFYRQVGVDQPTGQFDYEALRDEAASEQLREWGME